MNRSRHASLELYLAKAGAALSRGPTALILAEDPVEVGTTLRHHLSLGFREVVLLAHPDLPVDPAIEAMVSRVDFDVYAEDALVGAVNRVIPAAAGSWLYYGYNAEYLFYPFCETRNVRELIAFNVEERRSAFVSFVIDLYAGDLWQYPNAVSLEEAMLDRTGYYALQRKDETAGWAAKDRQMDFYGGLRWRFEEHVPWTKRKIDRIALFKATPDLRLRPDFTFCDEEYNTYQCQWHHNVTTAICSFRTAKALKANPSSRYDIPTFLWRNSIPFEWQSRQLMDLGLMEPGQWF